MFVTRVETNLKPKPKPIPCYSKEIQTRNLPIQNIVQIPISEEKHRHFLPQRERLSLSLSLFVSPSSPFFATFLKSRDTTIDYRETDILDSRFLEDSGFVGERCTHQLTWRSGPRHINRTENQQRPSADGPASRHAPPHRELWTRFSPPIPTARDVTRQSDYDDTGADATRAFHVVLWSKCERIVTLVFTSKQITGASPIHRCQILAGRCLPRPASFTSALSIAAPYTGINFHWFKGSSTSSQRVFSGHIPNPAEAIEKARYRNEETVQPTIVVISHNSGWLIFRISTTSSIVNLLRWQ